MKAAVIRKYGKPEVFRIEEMPEPSPKSDEVKVKIMASSVNPVDWKVRSGEVFFLTGFWFPRILGGDFSGIITSCGANVKDLQIGDEVYGLSPAMFTGGAYAEYIALKPSKMALKPANLNHQQAASIPLAGLTAYQAMHKLGKMKPGMRILITGCTGGVGHFAVQMAKAENCHVTGVCHSRNEELARQVGCDEVLPYDKTHFTEQQVSYDIIFDPASKDGYWNSKSVLNTDGIYVSTLPTPLLMFMHALSFFIPWKQGKFVGVASKRADLEKLSGLCNSGKLKPFIEHIFPLEKIAEAHALSETEKVRGKIVLEISDI